MRYLAADEQRGPDVRFWEITVDLTISDFRVLGIAEARPKTYELGPIDSLTTIVSFPGIYLISGWFMGSHRTREGNARRPPSFIYARIPLGVPLARFLALEGEGIT
jgi:hypothetical protein